MKSKSLAGLTGAFYALAMMQQTMDILDGKTITPASLLKDKYEKDIERAELLTPKDIRDKKINQLNDKLELELAFANL